MIGVGGVLSVSASCLLICTVTASLVWPSHSRAALNIEIRLSMHHVHV